MPECQEESPVISWDGLIEAGYEPASGPSVAEQIEAKPEYEALKALMDTEDIRIAQAFELKELFGFPVTEIACKLDVSGPRVYQFIARAKAIGKQYREYNK